MSTAQILALGAGAVGTALLASYLFSKPDTLPYGPYTTTALPINSDFQNGVLDPFKLLSVFSPAVGQGSLTFQNQLLYYNSEITSWISCRTGIQAGRVYMRFIWRPISGSMFICEGWDAYNTQIGHTSMIVFDSGKLYQGRGANLVYIGDFDPYSVDWVTVEMWADYSVPKIEHVKINNLDFYNLPILDEVLGAVPIEFWQLQFYLPQKASALVKEIVAFNP